MDFQFSSTQFLGYEDEILKLLHRNRSETFTKEYLQWRYLGEPSPVPPAIFWVQNKNGDRIGMCSLIFRKYWLNNEPFYMGVAGDTSLDNDYRGKGIAKNLFLYINDYLRQNNHPCALAIANESFCRAASAARWNIDQTIVPYVCILDWTIILRRFIPIDFIANMFGCILNLFRRRNRSNLVKSGLTHKIVNETDPSFDSYWNDFDKKNMLIKDRSQAILQWRYNTICKNKFSIFQIYKDGSLLGYFIYSISKNGTCVVSDCVLKNSAVIEPAVIMFVNALKTFGDVSSIRIVVNESHPYIPLLSKIGFVKRKPEGSVMIHEPAHKLLKKDTIRFVFIGDKDI